jgi:hypothetical protein
LLEDPAAWTNKQLDAAYQALANCSWVGVDPDARAGLMCQFVGAYELLSLCNELKTETPPFWAHWQPKGKVDLRELARLVSWFEMKSVIHISLFPYPCDRKLAAYPFKERDPPRSLTRRRLGQRSIAPTTSYPSEVFRQLAAYASSSPPSPALQLVERSLGD